MSSAEPSPDAAEYVPFEEFRTGLPAGHFRVIVNPKLAGPFVAYRTHANALALALIGPGIAAALVGHLWLGAGLTAAGILLRRVIRQQAPRILLHLAARVPAVYEQATENAVMEVRRAR